jgi:AraC-like DNA-binding protein
VSDLGTGFGARLARSLGPALAPAVALRLLASEVRCLVLDNPADPLVTEAARLLGRPQAQAGDVAAQLGVGERQLLRRCRAAVGYGPATLRRVLRFRRFVARVDAGEGLPGRPDLARLAADTGYADQAHLTHECVRLAGLPPAALTAERRPAAA